MRKIRRKFKRPRSPWNSAQIKEEKDILKEYGLRRKRELWRAREILRNYRRRARQLIAESSEDEEVILLEKMQKLGILSSKDSGLDGVLTLDIRNVLDRRLQTIVFRKGISKTINGARQMVVHGKISVNDRKVTYPSFIVPVEKEKSINAHKVKHD